MVKKLRASNSMDRISELPKDILHRILYFLSQKEVVRTSVLSKSWRRIWCTRPNLDFSYSTYDFNSKEEFVSIVTKNLQRYFDQRTCLQEFHLSIRLDDSDQGLVSLLEKWIPLLTTMGTKKFHLSIRSDGRDEGSVKLPSVVFGAESLEYLHLQRFVLDQEAIERIVLFKHLRSLHLHLVRIDDEIFHKIISRCPLIEKLRVERCVRLRTIKLNDLHSLKDFFFQEFEIFVGEELCRIEIHPTSLEKLWISSGNIWFHRKADFRSLKDLWLCGVRSPMDHFSSCKFPSLQFLHIYRCDGLKESSQLFINAPNIVYFQYLGYFVPSISIATTSSVWYSDIHLTLSNVVTSLWFLELKELLKSLSQSEISLSFDQHHMAIVNQENINMEQGINGCDDQPVVVESLTLRCLPSSFSPVLHGAFAICRPRKIGEYGYRGEIGRIQCMWKILMEREIGKFRDLEEVRMEICERNRNIWHQTSLSELLNYQPGEYIATRFRLKWRETE